MQVWIRRRYTLRVTGIHKQAGLAKRRRVDLIDSLTVDRRARLSGNRDGSALPRLRRDSSNATPRQAEPGPRRRGVGDCPPDSERPGLPSATHCQHAPVWEQQIVLDDGNKRLVCEQSGDRRQSVSVDDDIHLLAGWNNAVSQRQQHEAGFHGQEWLTGDEQADAPTGCPPHEADLFDLSRERSGRIAGPWR
ncbi:MAG TPA: hypothetical protein DEU95_10310 [Chloroflexi bacterium]|nr:hypothetical protein [Chloroflexota bacterium]